MDVKIINPFLVSCENAFKNMFDMPPQHKDPYLLDPNAGHAWEISGLLGITGDYNGVVAFRLHKILADKMLERLLSLQEKIIRFRGRKVTRSWVFRLRRSTDLLKLTCVLNNID